MLNLTAEFPLPVLRLLSSSFIFVLGRAVSVTFITLYLAQRFQFDVQQIGWILGSSLFTASLSGMIAGYLADRYGNRLLMVAACLMAALSAVCFALTVWSGVAICAIMALEISLQVRSIALKARLADTLEPARRMHGFSVNYLLINLAFGIGPLIGTWLFSIHFEAPLWMTVILCLMAAPLAGYRDETRIKTDAAKHPGFIATLRAMRQDNRLIMFTLAGMLVYFATGRFTTGYLAQYLLTTGGTAHLKHLLPIILTTNAIGVVLLQYAVGKRIDSNRLLPWLCFGISMYIVGLVGFAIARADWSWVAATAVFTFGEVIIVPCEYALIDMIAPTDKRGSYYGAQGLIVFGIAINPIVCGFLLAHFAPLTMFLCLIAFALAGMALYVAGSRVRIRISTVTKIPAKTMRPDLNLASKYLARTRVKNLNALS